MVKYDKGFKQKVVHAYLAGEGGYAALATRFGVPSKTNISKWVSAFQEFGEQVNKYIYYYNNERIKAKLTGMSPVEYRLHTSQLAA